MKFVLADWCGEMNISPIIDLDRQTHLTYLQILKVLNGLEKEDETSYESVSFNERFKWVFIKDDELELQDNGIVRRFNNIRLEELLNELHKENAYLKSELNRYKYLKERKIK